MDRSDDRIFLAVDGGGHRQLLVKTNNNAEKLASLEVPHTEGMTENDLNDACYKAAEQLVGRAAGRRLAGIVQGCSGIPQSDGTYTNNPNTPRSMGGRISVVPFLSKKFGLTLEEHCVWQNDCTAGALTAVSPFGHERMDFRVTQEPLPAKEGDFFRFRAALRPGDKFRTDYDVAVYTTISSGTNDGVVLRLNVPRYGPVWAISKGEFQKTPENGHKRYVMTDPFGNELFCGCGGLGHLEAAMSGGTGISGISSMMRKAVRRGQVHSGQLYEAITSTPDTVEGNLQLAPKLYAITPGSDPNADKLKRFVAEAVAHHIGYIWGCVGAGKLEIGGGMMHSYDQIVIPAIKMIQRNPTDFANQPWESFPDIAVAKDFGRDYIWMGPLFMLLNKDRFVVTGQDNYSVIR